MILGKSAIQQAIEAGDIVIRPFDPKKLGPNSYDLELADLLVRYKKSVIRYDEANDMVTVPRRKDGTWLLHPGTLYLGHTKEWTETKKFVPMVEGRSSVGRLGIRIHATAGFGDVGFCGQWTLEIDAVQPVVLAPHIRICQIFWHTIEGSIDSLYQGKYSHSSQVMGSQLYLDLKKDKS